jgi:tRNA-Thr(GGU) m(6)t(6)A37 methyltransferase TsaA
MKFQPIGTVASCYKEKFGVPRQAGLVKSARAKILLPNSSEMRAATTGLELCSHVWVIFAFHLIQDERWQPSVRPPRLGGRERRGVLATRSPHRPNPIGLSAVRLLGVDHEGPHIVIRVEGGDFVDGTPVLDIKPYVSYCDAIVGAHSEWDCREHQTVEVRFSSEAEVMCRDFERQGSPGLRALITEVLAMDPRPAAQASAKPEADYGVNLDDFDVRWKVEEGRFTVTEIVRVFAGKVRK